MQKEKNAMIINARKENTQHEFAKIDFVKSHYPLLSTIQEVDKIRFLSMDDIIPNGRNFFRFLLFKENINSCYGLFIISLITIFCAIIVNTETSFFPVCSIFCRSLSISL